MTPDAQRLWQAGDTAMASGDIARAEAAYRQAAALTPKHAPGLHQLGRVLLMQGKSSEAQPVLETVVKLQPSAAALCDLGTAASNLGDLATAERLLRRAVKRDPNLGVAWFNLANALRFSHQTEAARAAFAEAQSRLPGVTAPVIAIAETLADEGRYEDAIRHLDQTSANESQNTEFRQIKALIQLRSGDLAGGLTTYESRFLPSPRQLPPRHTGIARWNGEDLTGSTLLVWLEQGIGDAVLASRWLGPLAKMAKRCIVECEPRLAPLLSKAFPNLTIATLAPPGTGTVSGAADFQTPIWSAARFLDTAAINADCRDGYLVADTSKRDEFRARYTSASGGKPLIGFSWRSFGDKGRFKTPPREAWRPLLELEGVAFVDIQYAAETSEREKTGEMARHWISDPTIDHINRLDDAAAQIAALDAVVTVSNTAAHLSGALGMQTWTIVPKGFGRFWYWHDDTESRWYGRMTLASPSTPGDWTSAIDHVVRAVQQGRKP